MDPWLEKSDECAVCRASLADAMELPRACFPWCCEPPQSGAQRNARQDAADRARRRQQQDEQARLHELAQEHERRDRDRDAMAAHGQAHSGTRAWSAAAPEGRSPGSPRSSVAPVQFHADNSPTSVAPPAPVAAAAAPAAGGASAALLRDVAAIRSAVHELAGAVERSGLTRGGGSGPLAVLSRLPALQSLSDRSEQLCVEAQSGYLSPSSARAAIHFMTAQLPALHTFFSGSRHRDDIAEALVTLDSVMHFAAEQLQRQQSLDAGLR